MTTEPTAENTSTQLTVAARVAQLLAGSGAAHVFGVVGSGNYHLTNHLIDAGVPFTAARHEGAAATMADAYTRLSTLQNPNSFAIVSVHQGCGLTNTLTGVTEAAKSHTGMLVLTADTPTESVGSNFDIDQDQLVQSVGAFPHRITDPSQTGLVIHDVLREIRSGHTVVLSLPIDVQELPVDDEQPVPTPTPRTGTIPQLSQVTRAAKSLVHAKRPLILAGRGALRAEKELTELADTTGALLATSAVASGMFADHPWNVGISGGFSSPVAAELIREADVLVSFGSALNDWTTRDGELIGEETTLIQIDRDPWAIGRFRAVSQTLVADSASVAVAIASEFDRLHPENKTGYRTEAVAQKLTDKFWNSTLPLPEGEDLSTEDTIDPRVLTDALNDLLPTERVLSTDSGNFMGYPMAYLRVPDSRGVCFTQAFQSIGLGLGTLIGSALAVPERLPVLGTGDGGFAMGISELETLVRLKMPAVVLIYNDAGYGAEVHHFGRSDETVTFPDTDFASIARGYGAHGVTVRTIEDLKPAVTEWLSTEVERTASGHLHGTPLVIDAKVSSDGGAWWLRHAFGH